MNTAELLDALRAHYIRPGTDADGAVFLTEVTAPNSSRRIDAVHIGLWSSRGYGVDAHELKTSRADFMRELDNPAKAQAWWSHCNRFWIVAPDTTVAPVDLLPDGWGLMVPSPRGGRRFKAVVKAAHRDLAPTVGLLAALLTSTETARVNQLNQVRRELRSRYDEDVARVRREAAAATDPAVRSRLKLVDELETACGLTLSDWAWGDRTDPAELGAAIRGVVMEARGARDLGAALNGAAAAAGRIVEAVEAARQMLATAG